MVGDPKRKRIAPETGGEPHFHIVDVTYEITSDGNILITAYDEVHNELRVQFYAKMMPSNVIKAASNAQRTAAEAINFTQFQAFIDGGGNSH